MPVKEEIDLAEAVDEFVFLVSVAEDFPADGVRRGVGDGHAVGGTVPLEDAAAFVRAEFSYEGVENCSHTL